MIRSKCFLEVPFLTFLALHIKRKRCGHMRFIPSNPQSQVVSACQRFRPVAPFFFLAKVPFLPLKMFLKKIQKGVWPYRYALVTLIIYIYGLVCLAPSFFLAKVPFLAFFFNMEGGVAI